MRKCQKCTVLIVVLGLVVAMATAVSAIEGAKININTAAVEELAQLNQIGTKTAERIVAYRKANGPFKAPEDLMKVKGIGEKIFMKNKGRISV